jgi:hypothetical protein
MKKSRNLEYCIYLTPQRKCKNIERQNNDCKCLEDICCWSCPDKIYEQCKSLNRCLKVEEKLVGGNNE